MRESTRNAVLVRLKLLEEAIAGSRSIPKTFVAACASQGAIAQLQLPTRGVTPLSLNALKKASDQVVDGGWAHIDGLRVKVLNASEEQPVSASSAIHASRSDETERLRILVATADRGRLRITRAYMDLLAITCSAAVRDEQLRHELARHRALWLEELGGPTAAADGRQNA